MEVKKNFRKTEQLLKNVLEGNIVLDENQTERLLRFLEDRKENSPGKLLLDTPCFSDLIFGSLENLCKAPTSVQVFIIEIVTILFKNELQFNKMHMQGFQKFYCQFCVLGNLNNDAPPNLHLACIKLATMQVTHCSGLSIIKDHRIWKYILYPNIHHRSKKISDAVYNFMAKLVWKLNEYNNEQALMEVLGYIVQPILSSEYLNVPILDAETDTELSDKIYPYLSALLAVLTEAQNYPATNKVISSLKDYFFMDHRLFEIFNGTKNSRLLKLLNSCIFRYIFEMLRHLLFSKQVDDFCNKMSAFHRNYIVHAIKKREAVVIVDFVIQCNIIWSQYKKVHMTEFNFPVTFERNGTIYDFSLQILVHILMPILKFGSLQTYNVECIEDLIEQFIVKMGRTVTDYIVTSCYLFGEYLEEGCDSFKKQITTHTLKELLRLKGNLTDSQAGPIFQSLYYLLENFITFDENHIDAEVLSMLTHLLEAIKMFLKEHNIPWYENLEIVNIQADLLNLLAQNFLTTKQVAQVLDLIDICVKKFLSPNMSLLVESKCNKDSTLSEINKVIKLYSQHADWEVRDSALNLLNTCTEISFIKYIPLQKMLEDNDLINLAAKVALTDSEFYSQSTALKCLTAATKIDHIWHKILVDNADIYLQLIDIARNHGEGMVRKEAVNVLSGVYASQKLTPNFLNTLYEVMLTAAIDDLHWEVQLAALNFWKSAIHKHLTYRGMLDGKFPSVTFSREKRKIIILNEKEIHRQLAGIMTELSNVGCLTVLLDCMNDINNIEVMDQAYCIVKDLVEMLDKYKFHKVMIYDSKTEPDELTPTFVEQSSLMPMDLSRTSDEERNNVIDGILSVDQSELIMELHDNYCQMKSEQMDIDSAYFARRELVQANEFLETFRSNDYSLKIKDKKNYAKCVSTLDELLDEMLGI